MVRWLAGVALIAGCKKEVVDTGPTGSCEDIETTNLSAISAADYPPGLAEQIVIWRSLPGIYEADYCGRGPITVKLDQMPIPEELQYVTAAIDERIPCGCTTDPSFVEDDNALGAHTWAYTGSILLFDPDTELDPGIVEPMLNSIPFQVDWALLPTDAPFSMRGCTYTPVVDDLAVYDNATILVRVDATGGLSGTVELVGDDTSQVCELTQFVFVAENGA